MATTVPFERDFDPPHGMLETVAPGLRRIVVPNGGPFTFRGTNTYVLGEGTVAVVDPGPDDAAHRAALLAALGAERVSHILITHTHLDHSPGAAALAAETGAVTCGFGPHATPGSGDAAFVPDLALADGAVLDGRGWAVEAIHTPGHCANHLAFALAGGEHLLSGDHVMGWSTTVVKPPDGDMAAYMASLARLEARAEHTFWPGHGAPLRDPAGYMAALRRHREDRDAEILAALAAGAADLDAIVAAVYPDIPDNLRPAAAQTAHAHLLHLAAQGRVAEAAAGWRLTGD